MKQSKETGTAFKALLRKRHADRLRTEHGLIVDATTFDVTQQDTDDPLSYQDPTGRPLVPVLPPPPIDGPDVSFKDAQSALAGAPGAREEKARCGKKVWFTNQTRVHQLLAAYAMLKIERLYGTVFENILGEKVSTQPVITLNGHGDGRRVLCLHCQSQDRK